MSGLHQITYVSSDIGVRHVSDDELRTRLREGRETGDPAADALVEVFRALPGRAGWSVFERALEGGIDAVPDAPPELHRLLEETSVTPPWFDQELIDAGAMSFWRVGLLVQIPALIYGSLAYGYQYGDLARPLAATGRLERMASRRILETTRWLLAVTAPGAMAPWREGWQASLRVRMVHALIRRHLLDSEGWDVRAWGMPINATGMLATAIGGFDIVPRRALQDMGVQMTGSDREAHTALWRWVAQVMGVPPKLLPESHSQAERLISLMETVDLGTSEDGPALMRALTRHGLPLDGVLPSRTVDPARAALTPITEALVRRWLGDEVSDQLGVGRTPVVHLVPLVRPLVRLSGILLASGLLGDERQVTRRQIALVNRSLDRRRRPLQTISPEQAAGAHARTAVAPAQECSSAV